MTSKEYNPITYVTGDLVLNKYQIKSEIGKGGMNSIVYLAEDTQVNDNEYFAIKNKLVAVKVINRDESVDDDNWTKFSDECVTATRVTHKTNIVDTYEITKANNDNTVIIVMEYIDGPSLRKYIDSHGCLSVKESMYFFLEVLKAIKELHNFKDKIIHRDLKPDNIMLTRDLRNIKIIDFGISSVTDFNQDVITNEKIAWGTFPYLHPGVLTKGLNAETKTKMIGGQFDIYALGVILYEMLIGKYPFLGDYHKQEYIKLAQKYDFVSLNDIDNNIPAALENVIFRCLAVKHEDIKYRYNNIQEIIDDINHIIANPTQATTIKLLKPKNKRVLQIPMAFNVENQRLKEKFYEKKWFYFASLAVAVVCVIVTIILAINHEFIK